MHCQPTHWQPAPLPIMWALGDCHFAKNGKICWSSVPHDVHGRAATANVIKMTPGITRFAVTKVSDIKTCFEHYQHPSQPALPQHQPEQPQPQPHSGHLILKERGVRSAQAVRTERQTYCASTARNITAKNTLKVCMFLHTETFTLFFLTSFWTSNWFLLVWFAWLVVVCLTLQIYILC